MDVLALGQHLVRELGLEDSVDTLGRWMAHHVAELINQARVEPPGRTRSEAQKRATETILALWEHRENLPHNAYPLAPYKDLLRVLDLMQPNDNPFRFSSLSKTQQSAAILFDRLSRLVILLLLMPLPDNGKPKALDGSAVKAMNDDEQQVLKRINEWAAVLPVSSKRAKPKRISPKKTSRSAKLDVKSMKDSVIRFIDDLQSTLGELRSDLKRNTFDRRTN